MNGAQGVNGLQLQQDDILDDQVGAVCDLDDMPLVIDRDIDFLPHSKPIGPKSIDETLPVRALQHSGAQFAVDIDCAPENPTGDIGAGMTAPAFLRVLRDNFLSVPN